MRALSAIAMRSGDASGHSPETGRTFGISTRMHGAPGLVNLQKQGLRHYSSIFCHNSSIYGGLLRLEQDDSPRGAARIAR